MDDEKRFCQNCKRDIPLTNYEMHTVHCHRNIQLCTNCEEPVPRSEMENHIKEFHTITSCSDCREKMECSAMDNHKENLCSKRTISCQYCDLELKAEGIPDHENYCGSRTDDCEVCGKIYMHKFRDFHLNSNHRLTKPNEEISSESDDDVETIDDNSQNNYPRRFQRNSVARNRDYNYFHRSVPYENNLRRNQGPSTFNDFELDEYFGNMDIENICNMPGVAFQSSSNVSRATSREEEPTYIPCEFCGVSIISEKLVLHETGCRPDLVSHKSSTTDTPKEYWTQHIVHEIYDDDDDDVRYVDHERENEVLIPCEFCDRHFSVDAVSHHQIACGNNHGFDNEVQD